MHVRALPHDVAPHRILAVDAHVAVLLRDRLARHVETGDAPRVPVEPAAVHLHVRVLLAFHIANADLRDRGESCDLVVTWRAAPPPVQSSGIETHAASDLVGDETTQAQVRGVVGVRDAHDDREGISGIHGQFVPVAERVARHLVAGVVGGPHQSRARCARRLCGV